MGLNETFLFKLRLKHKKLFYFILFYLIVTITTSLLGFQITPFYNWGMFSTPAIKVDSYSIMEIYCDGKLLNQPHTYNDFSRVMVHYPTSEYLRLVDKDFQKFRYKKVKKILHKVGFGIKTLENQIFINNHQLFAYKIWLKNYIKSNLVNHFKNIELYETKINYLNDGTLKMIDKKLIFKL